MRFVTALRLGFHRLHRRLGVVLLAYLAALVPALLFASLVRSDLADALDDSIFAERVFAGERFAVWMDFASSPAYSLGPVWGALGPSLWLVLLIQVLVSAGIVEVLLGTTPRDQRPFLAGVGRHGWRFLRSTIWFFASLALVAVALGVAGAAAGKHATAAGDGTLLLYIRLVVVALFAVAFIPLKLAYDLSRVAAAAHGDGATLRGFVRALGYALAHPAILAPLYLTFAVAALALSSGYLAARDLWSPPGPWWVLALFAGQQTILLARAYLRTGLWAAEISYYQAIGDPRWCRPSREGR